MEKVPEQFLETYRFFLNKHCLTPWTSPALVIFVLGGNNIISKHCLRRIFNRDSYQVPDEEVTLAHHQASKGPVKINLRDAVEFLIDEYMDIDTDSCALFNDPLIQSHLEDWIRFSKSADGVDLFDKSTWPDGDDFSALQELVMTEIVPLASHQQRIENYIQMAGLVAQTGVHEMRCTWRAILQVGFIRPFNEYAIEYVEAKQSADGDAAAEDALDDMSVDEDDEDVVPSSEESSLASVEADSDDDALECDSEDEAASAIGSNDVEEAATPKQKVKRVRGSVLMHLLAQQSTSFIEQCDNARAKLGPERVKAIKAGLNTKKNKTSTEQREKEMKKCARPSRIAARRLLRLRERRVLM